MRIDLERDLLTALQPYILKDDFEAVKMLITIALSKYDVSVAETHLVVWDGEKNDQILKKFLAAKIAAGCSGRTVDFYHKSIAHTLQYIGKPYDEINADDIRMYLAMRVRRDGVSKTTANNERRNISSFYGWLQREEILLRNPMTKVDSIKVTKKKRKAFEQMDLEKMRNKCRSRRESALIELLISTWARVSEVAIIRIDELHGDHLTVHGKGDKDREVYLNAKAQLAIENYMQDRKDSNPYLFPRAKYAGDVVQMTKGKRRRLQCNWYQDPNLVDEDGHIDKGTIESIIRRLGRSAGVANAHPHRFRRTGATMALRNGMPLIQVSKLLGHESIGTTQIYLDISDEELEQAHKKFVN